MSQFIARVAIAALILTAGSQAWAQSSCTDSRDCPPYKGTCVSGRCVGFQVTAQATPESVRVISSEISMFAPTSGEVELPSTSVLELYVIQADGSTKSKLYNMTEIVTETTTRRTAQ